MYVSSGAVTVTQSLCAASECCECMRVFSKKSVCEFLCVSSAALRAPDITHKSCATRSSICRARFIIGTFQSDLMSCGCSGLQHITARTGCRDEIIIMYMYSKRQKSCITYRSIVVTSRFILKH